MMDHLSSDRFKRFVRHLCVVSGHYSSREEARNVLSSKLVEYPELHHSINNLIRSEVKIAEIGSGKRIPHDIKEELIKTRFDLRQAELDRKHLEAALKHVDTLDSGLTKADRKKSSTHKRVERIEKKVNKDFHIHIKDELRSAIKQLEKRYKEIQNDDSLHPARLHKIALKIKEYKGKLAKL